MTMILVRSEIGIIFKNFSKEIGCSDKQLELKDIKGFKTIVSYDEKDDRLCEFVKMLYAVDEAS